MASAGHLAQFAVAHSPPALIPPQTLRWARESVGLTLEDAAHKVRVSLDKLRRAERGEDHLTFRQAEGLARAYARPLAALFLSEPPDEEPPEAQFRRLPGSPEPPWGHEMRALARLVRERQEAAVELYELLQETPAWRSVEIDYSDDPAALGARARAALGIHLEEQQAWWDRSGYRPLREWISAAGELGVLVMQDGSMPVKKLRGFASIHHAVPAIVANMNDDPRARAFTVIHELGHLLRARAGHDPRSATERWFEEFASNVLMPRESFVADFERSAAHPLDSIDELALRYGVTPKAAAVRVARLRLASQYAIDELLDAIEQRAARAGDRSSGGGNYYATIVGRLGPTFIDLVFSAVDGQALGYAAAAGLLGVKVNNFAKLRSRAAKWAAS